MQQQVADHMDAYWLHLQTRADLSPQTVDHYLKVARVWRAWCASHGLTYDTATAVEILTWLRGSGLKHSSVRAYTIGIRLYYAFLFSKGLVTVDPAAEIRTPKRRKEPVVPFENTETAAIHEACETPLDAAMVLLFFGCGLRRGELRAVTRKDVDWKSGVLRVHGKGGKTRLAPLSEGQMLVLKLAFQARDDLVPYSYDWIYRRFRFLCAKAGIDGKRNPHRMRHTFGTSYVESGGKAEDLQILLGHSTLEQTLFYSQTGRERRALQAGRDIDLTKRLFH